MAERDRLRVLYYAAAYWFYLNGLRRVPASFAAVCFYLIPVFGVAASFVLLGERFESGQWLGVAVVLAAVLGIAVGRAAGHPRTVLPVVD